MPAKSEKQRKFMQAVANNPSFAKKVGVPQSVGREYSKAKGGEMAESKQMMRKEVAFMKKKGAPKSMIKHEMAESKTKAKTKGMAMGGAPNTASPNAQQSAFNAQKNAFSARQSAFDAQKGAVADKLAAVRARLSQKGAMPGTARKYAAGGLTGGHKSADGIAKKGKTKARKVTMAKGGYRMGGKSC